MPTMTKKAVIEYAWFRGPFAALTTVKKATPRHGTPSFSTSIALTVAAKVGYSAGEKICDQGESEQHN